jgi:xylulokinase
MSKQKGSYVLGSDLGTSGCKSIVLDADGRICGRAFREYPTSRPRPGWAEQNPDDWFDAFCVTAHKAIGQAGIHPKSIAAVSIVGITHNAVLLDERDEVLRPSIIYTDTRSLEQSKALQEQWGDRVFRETWNQLSPIWTWPQLLWLREEEPQIWKRVRRILFPKDYVRYRLVPMFLSDKIDPIGTLLYDPINGQWIDEFCNSLGLPAEAFPQSVSPLQIVGGISKSGAEAAGLYPGTPIIAGTTDTAAEVFGTGALTPGQTIIKLATVGRIAAVSQNPLDHPTVLNYPHVLPGLWYPGTCTKFAASAFSWARQVFWDQDGHHYDYKRMNQAVETVPPGSDGLLFHPYLAGEFAPSWDPYLRASFLGVGINHQRAHFTRAVMEGVAYALRDALMSILEMGLYVKELRLIGGGATSGIWGQIITDNLQREVLVPEGTDAAYGSALLAGIAAGMFDKSSEGIDHLIKIRSRLTPEKRHMIIYDELFSIYKQSADATKALSHRLHAFQTSNLVK